MGCSSSTDKPPTVEQNSVNARKLDKNRRELAAAVEQEEKRKAEDDFTSNLLHERNLLSLHASFMMKLRGSYTGDLLRI